MINVAVLGYGTVGSGVVEVINKNNAVVNKHANEEINVKYVLDLRDFPGDPVEKILVHDYNIILNDDDVKIVVEVMGGVEPAYTFVKNAILKGKSVCTSNKELVAKKGAELIKLAKENNANFLFEASVGGGIPIIRPMINSLTADNFDEITGILNGTTNYILTKMANENLAFDTVLKQAQDMGYAERNPDADILGYDACRKIAILTSLMTGSQVDYEDIYTEGITKITQEDFAYAKAMDASIKIFGTTKVIDGKIYSLVSPFMINRAHCLYSVDDVFNGVSLHGDMLGDVMFYGKGAGKTPTASAVVSDVVDAAKNLGNNMPIIWDETKIEVADINDFVCGYFVRISGAGLNEKVRAAFNDAEILRAIDGLDETAFIVPAMSEGEFNEKIKAFELITRIRTSFK